MNHYKLVFFTDDDHDDLFLMQEISVALGHTCQIFHSGSQLIDFIKNLETKPDLIFLDIHMPIVDGYEILGAIRSYPEFAAIPIIIHSGNCDENCIQKCLELGANYFITKAFNYTHVSDAIAYAINKDWSSHIPIRENFVHHMPGLL